MSLGAMSMPFSFASEAFKQTLVFLLKEECCQTRRLARVALCAFGNGNILQHAVSGSVMSIRSGRGRQRLCFVNKLAREGPTPISSPASESDSLHDFVRLYTCICRSLYMH
jgi:hypothetical protein